MNPVDWLIEAFAGLTDEIVAISPSEWAEEFRRLPGSVTSLPGPYDYAVTPYLREPADCLDQRSPVRDITIMKGAQTGGTVGVMENGLGYFIAHIKTAPIMMVTANQALANLRMDEYITPMLEQSELSHLIQSNTDNKRKAGATARKMSWYGGGFFIATSANEAANLRSASVRILYLDELDAYPLRVGKDGDPSALAGRRTSAFTKSRKIVKISTPTTVEDSRISVEYDAGDRRKWMVPCLGCGEYQELRWRVDDRNGKQKGGIVWALTDEGNIKPGSVMYACPHCGHCHTNEHKRIMLPRGRWEATAIPSHPSVRSYHISGLMSPADFYSWEDAARDWLKAWNVETNRVRDVEKLQEFYNNVLGLPFRMSGARLTLAKVGRHVREYRSGMVPNALAETMCGGKIGYLTCAADVHKTFISAAVYAWGPNRVGFKVATHRFDGDTSDPKADNGPWGELVELIDTKYSDGIDREYPIKLTLVDSGYDTGKVYAFCERFGSSVYPVKGDERIVKGANREFKRMEGASKSGRDAWLVNVNHYKHRLSTVLGTSPRPATEPALVDSVSFPEDIDDKTLRELTAEEFVQKGKKWEWRRVLTRNEAWDLAVYNSAARDITAYMLCREHFQLETINWSELWPWLNSRGFGWAAAPPVAGD